MITPRLTMPKTLKAREKENSIRTQYRELNGRSSPRLEFLKRIFVEILNEIEVTITLNGRIFVDKR
jgi:hypothetical protein